MKLLLNCITWSYIYITSILALFVVRNTIKFKLKMCRFCTSVMNNKINAHDPSTIWKYLIRTKKLFVKWLLLIWTVYTISGVIKSSVSLLYTEIFKCQAQDIV